MFLGDWRRSLAILAVLLSVIGLAATAGPARAAVSVASSAQGRSGQLGAAAARVSVAASAGQSFSIDINPNITVNSTTLKQILFEDYGDGDQIPLSALMKRLLNAYQGGFPASLEMPALAFTNFSGSVSVDPDGAGVTVNITTPDTQTTGWWQRTAAMVIGNLVGFMLVRAECVLWYTRNGQELTNNAKVGCATAGAALATVLTGILYQNWTGTLPDAGQWISTVLTSLTAAAYSAAWESEAITWVTQQLNGILALIGSWFAGIVVNYAVPGIAIGAIALYSYLLKAGQYISGLVGGIQPRSTPESSDVCDVYGFYGTPCTASYSMTRALYSSYNGPLYQVKRTSDGTTADIGLLSPGGDVDASQQDSFCADTSCTITKVYDQSALLNDLTIGPAGSQAPADKGADAAALPITVGGSSNPVEAYGLDIMPGVGYRDNNADGIATGSEPEGMYMVTSGTHVNSKCCFDFGNAEVSTTDTGGGHMDAVNFSTRCNTNYGGTCSGSGPWVQADLENGLFQAGGNGTNPNKYNGNTSDFVTAMLKNQGGATSATNNFELEGGNAQSGTLSQLYSGPLPTPEGKDVWAPMSKEGAIVLGIGGDNSNAGEGSFFEGVMTDGTPTDAADAEVQANIVAAGYGGDSAGTGVTQNADAAVVNNGLTYDFSVDAKNGDLQESSLTAQGANWATKDLSATAGTPPVLQGTTPVAVVHDGVTSVFTISAADDHLWETHMRPGVTAWKADDLTALAGTPPSKVTPSALFHDGYTTVYTVNASNGHLQTTYLKVLNGPWATADLTAQTPGAPAVQPGTSPASILHDGVASVFTVGTGHDIWETYLPTIDGKWSAHDITALSQGPQTTSTVTAVFHDGVLTVFAAGDPLRHLFKLSLPALGSGWSAEDLTAGAPNTPPVAPGTAPAALFHNGYTSVYTVDEKTLHLQTTYLSSLAGDYATEDLSADYKVPPTTETPVPLLHPGDTGAMDRLSVFTVNQFDNDLQDSDLVAEGDPWNTQDMYDVAQVPPVMVNASPTATWSVASDGVTYVFSSDPKNGDLIVTYLTAQGADWQTKDLTAAGAAPTPERNEVPSSDAIYTFPTAVAWKGHVTVFSVGNGHGHLWATTLSGPGGTWTGTDLTATTPGAPPTNVTPSAVFHGGQLNAYVVAGSSDATAPGDLVQYYLPNGSNTWQVLDLTKAANGPQVAGGSAPSALFHDGYTSVYVNAAGTHHLQNYFLSAIGNSWDVQDLTKMAGTQTLPPLSSPTALYHSGYVTVFSLGADHGDIWETSLPAIGDNWTSQDLTAGGPHTPPVNPTFGGASIQSWLTAAYHSGYATVYSVNSGGEAWNTGGDLHATFLPAIGDDWQTQDLTTAASTPLTNSGKAPSALVHYDEHGGLTRTSVFTINYDTSSPPAGAPADYTLNNTYLVKIGDNWTSESLPN